MRILTCTPGKLDLGTFAPNVSHMTWCPLSKALLASQVMDRQRPCLRWVEIIPFSSTIYHRQPFRCRFRVYSICQRTRHPHRRQHLKNAITRTQARRRLAIQMAKVYPSFPIWRAAPTKAMPCHRFRKLHGKWTLWISSKAKFATRLLP